jgi:hypothetical protein
LAFWCQAVNGEIFNRLIARHSRCVHDSLPDTFQIHDSLPDT